MIRVAFLILAFVFASRPVFATCATQNLTVVLLDIVDGAVLVPVMVNGLTGSFVLDTGAAFSVVTPEAVRRFGIELDDWTSTTMRGVGGTERRRNANPRSIELGGIGLHRRSLARDATLRVADLATTTRKGMRIDGLLGRDFLSLFDLDLNFPSRRLTLYDVAGCTGRFLPWSVDYLSIPVENPAESALIVTVTLNGVKLHALLDTGASETLIAAPGMARLGLGLDRLRNDPSQIVNGLGPHTVTMWRHRFEGFQVGGENFGSPTFLVSPIQLNPISDLLLGADWLLNRQVWISFATNQLFVAE